MRCGHCKSDHQTIAQVKLCSVRGGVTVKDVEEELRPTGALWGWNDGMRKVKPSEVRREERQRDILAEINAAGRDVPAGSYAIRNQEGNANDISFYQIDKPTEGKWAGKTFVKQYLSSELVRVPRARQLAVIVAIAADPRGAAALYGIKLKHCGMCNKPLTNAESREIGIGPKCRMKQGW